MLPFLRFSIKYRKILCLKRNQLIKINDQTKSMLWTRGDWRLATGNWQSNKQTISNKFYTFILKNIWTFSNRWIKMFKEKQKLSNKSHWLSSNGIRVQFSQQQQTQNYSPFRNTKRKTNWIQFKSKKNWNLFSS